ncbi:MAG: hypothetical protein RIR40_190, partial [Actinomycetota bacterium]
PLSTGVFRSPHLGFRLHDIQDCPTSWVYKMGSDMHREILNSQKKISLRLSIFIIASLLFSIPSASAVIGDLDISFDTDGIVKTGIRIDSRAEAVVVQSDGKIIAAGFSSSVGNNDFALARYNPDGQLDTSFGTAGIVTTSVRASSEITSVALQSDGKIVAAGWSYDNSFVNNFGLARYNPDGQLDTSFGTAGIVTTSMGAQSSGAEEIKIQSDGKIVVAGYSETASITSFALARYNPDGSLDTSFGIGGKTTTSIEGNNEYANSLVIQSDGKIIAAGYSLNQTGLRNDNDFALVRYNTNGSLDTSFGTGGKVTTAIGSGYDNINTIAIQGDGKIVAAGYSDNINGIYTDFALVRYNTNGSLDTSFGTGGKVTNEIDPGDGSEAFSIVVQNDQKLVLAGSSFAGGGNSIIAVARYNVDGSLDTSFGTGGKTTTPIEALSRGRSVVVQTDGKILVAGSISDGTNLFFAVVRYLGTSATAPDSPTINSITSGDRRVTVSFTAGADNGATITDYEYSLNGGAFISAGITSSSFTITGLNGRSTYSVTIKARNSVGLSGASNSLSATTTNAALDASEAAASEAARAAEAARQKAQQELTEIFTLIPELGKLSQNLSKSSLKLVGKRCVKKGKVKYVPKSTKCPIGYKAKEK